MTYIKAIGKPIIKKYGFQIFHHSRFHSAESWCKKVFDADSKRWTSRHHFFFRKPRGNIVGYGAIYFDSEEDVMAFKLGWL